MDMQAIRTLALAKGLSDHQADVAADLVALAGSVHDIRMALWPAYVRRDVIGAARTNLIVSRASAAIDDALSQQVDRLGLSLRREAGERISDIATRLVETVVYRSEYDALIDELIEFCRTAPAVKPERRPYQPHRPVDIKPFWAGMDPAAIWPTGVVM